MSEKDAGTRGKTRAPSDIEPVTRELAAAVGAPEFALPWLDRFYDAEDAALVLAVAGGSLDGADRERLERAVRRAVLDVDDAGRHTPADFDSRLEIWAMFEGWKDVPLAVHRRLADWSVGHYAERIRPNVESARAGHPTDTYEARYSYVLLDEAEAIVAAQERIYLWPCDCRSIVSRCRKPMDVCLRFENDRGLGWEISRERAIQILRTTDKAGLMHTADVYEDPSRSTSICNCCTDCCYPHLAAERLGTADVWPVRRYVAAIDFDLCRDCGRCGLRCPFGAITCRQDGHPEFHAAECRGCGLCATGCSSDAIQLLPLEAPGP